MKNNLPIDINKLGINKLKKDMECCTRCFLNNENNNGPVVPNNISNNGLMIIGEGPGRVEDKFRIPFVGPSGKLLEKALSSVNINKNEVYITNIVKCRPPNNRTPNIKEAKFCADIWIAREIYIIKPIVIIALGNVALRYLYNDKANISNSRSRWFHTIYNVPCIASYHPAYLLRLKGEQLKIAKWNMFYDLKKAIYRLKM